MSETTITVDVTIPEKDRAKYTPEYIQKRLSVGEGIRKMVQHQKRARLEKIRDGQWCSRPPYGYYLDESGRLAIDYESQTPYHVLAVFLVVAKTRLQPSQYGVPSYKMVHEAFLYYNNRQDVKPDANFILAFVHRSTYIGHIMYQKKLQAYCEPIVPKVLFDIVQELTDRKEPLVPPEAIARPKNWRGLLWRHVLGRYERSVSDAEKWLNLQQKPTDPRQILDMFGVRVGRVYTKRYKRGGVWKKKRGPLDVSKSYSLSNR